MGRDAGDAFESNTKVLESYNKLHIQPGTLTAEYEQFGIVLLGTWRGINLYVSEEQYEDSSGAMKYFVPTKEVLVAATGIQSVMAYAGVSQVSGDLKGMEVYAGRRIPLIYWDPSAQEPELQETARVADVDDNSAETPSYAAGLASEREHDDGWHPSKPKQKRYVRRGMAFKPAALEKLKPGERLFVIDTPGQVQEDRQGEHSLGAPFLAPLLGVGIVLIGREGHVPDY